MKITDHDKSARMCRLVVKTNAISANRLKVN